MKPDPARRKRLVAALIALIALACASKPPGNDDSPSPTPEKPKPTPRPAPLPPQRPGEDGQAPASAPPAPLNAPAADGASFITRDPSNAQLVQAVLEKAIAAHGGPTLETLRESWSKCEVTFRAKAGAGESTALVSEWYQAPDRYRYQIREIPTPFDQGFNGVMAWARANRSTTRFPADDPKYAKDRAEILNRLAIRRFFLLVELQKAHRERRAVTYLGRHPLEGASEGRDPSLCLLAYTDPNTQGRHFYGFGEETGLLYQAWIHRFPAFDGGETAVRVDFSDFRRYQSGAKKDGPDTLVLPAMFQGSYITQDGRPMGSAQRAQAFSARIADEGRSFAFNHGVPREVFDPPSE